MGTEGSIEENTEGSIKETTEGSKKKTNPREITSPSPVFQALICPSALSLSPSLLFFFFFSSHLGHHKESLEEGRGVSRVSDGHFSRLEDLDLDLVFLITVYILFTPSPSISGAVERKASEWDGWRGWVSG